MSHPPVVLLCGGLGLRQRTEQDEVPKPLRPLTDGRPLLVHIMDYYRAFGVREIILCVGYGAAAIEQALVDALDVAGPATVDGNARTLRTPDLQVTLVDSGVAAEKCARLLDAQRQVGQRAFLLGYADVLSDFDLGELIDHHESAGARLTVVATRVRSRFGELVLGSGRTVAAFLEKPMQPALVSAGYFMCSPRLFDALAPELSFEDDVVPRLVESGEVEAVVHDGLWLALDTYKDFLDAAALMEKEGCPWLAPV